MVIATRLISLQSPKTTITHLYTPPSIILSLALTSTHYSMNSDLQLLSSSITTTATASPPPSPISPLHSPSHSPSPTKPPMARLPSLSLASRFPSSTTTTPTQFIESLSRALPSASISPSIARHPDFIHPSPPQLQRSLSQSSKHSKLDLLKLGRQRSRSRSASIGSVNSLLSDDHNRSGFTRSFSSGSISGGGNGRRSSREDGLPPIEDEEDTTASSRLADLSWGTKWWPFAIVEPTPSAEAKGKGKALNQSVVQEEEPPAKVQSRSFLEYFAGRGAVEEAKEKQEEIDALDKLEEELLDADIKDMLKVFTVGGEAKTDVELDLPPAPPPPSKVEHQTSFLPTSMFSSLSTSPTLAEGSSSSFMDGPSSLFSSFAIPNPFALSTSPSTSTSSTKPPRHGRSYSSGPGTTRKHVEGMLDEEDKKAAKVEDDSHMDMFTLIKDRYKCPKYPIVFCHGLFGSSSFL